MTNFYAKFWTLSIANKNLMEIFNNDLSLFCNHYSFSQAISWLVKMLDS